MVGCSRNNVVVAAAEEGRRGQLQQDGHLGLHTDRGLSGGERPQDRRKECR